MFSLHKEGKKGVGDFVLAKEVGIITDGLKFYYS